MATRSASVTDFGTSVGEASDFKKSPIASASPPVASASTGRTIQRELVRGLFGLLKKRV